MAAHFGIHIEDLFVIAAQCSVLWPGGALDLRPTARGDPSCPGLEALRGRSRTLSADLAKDHSSFSTAITHIRIVEDYVEWKPCPSPPIPSKERHVTISLRVMRIPGAIRTAVR